MDKAFFIFKIQDNTNNDVYLEAQIQNLCTSPMILEKVVLDTSDLYTSVELTTPQRFTFIKYNYNVF